MVRKEYTGHVIQPIVNNTRIPVEEDVHTRLNFRTARIQWDQAVPSFLVGISPLE